MKLTLTQKEMALLFEVAQIGCEGCGMWLTGLADDNYSWFKGSEIMDRLNWSKERVGGVMASLTDKGVVGSDYQIEGINKISYLNIDAKSEKNDNGEWVVIEGNDLYNVFEEWEKDYPKYCDNPFKEEASKPKPIRLSGNFVEATTDESEMMDEDDASLIATAPEMLKVLKEYVKSEQSHDVAYYQEMKAAVKNKEWKKSSQVLYMAMDVIAKAEGK